VISEPGRGATFIVQLPFGPAGDGGAGAGAGPGGARDLA
jgi:hypothetical protein